VGSDGIAVFMIRESKVVRGVVDWLLGGLAARLEFVERDVQELRQETKEIKKGPTVLAKVVLDHQRQIQVQTENMSALRRMHSMLAGRIGEPFPGQSCEICGGALVFDREPSKNAYVLRCPRRCGQTLVLPEAHLLETIKRLPAAIPDGARSRGR
jgi:hypothetical protein